MAKNRTDYAYISIDKEIFVDFDYEIDAEEFIEIFYKFNETTQNEILKKLGGEIGFQSLEDELKMEAFKKLAKNMSLDEFEKRLVQ